MVTLERFEGDGRREPFVYTEQRGARRLMVVEERVVEVEQYGAHHQLTGAGLGRNASHASRGASRGKCQSSFRRAARYESRPLA